ncbi:MAG: DUF4349 domain-containing protein [Acidobacteria bacterium]|nr:DUF4349 domain-containing protein [Acidobacteriota bacterium]
MKRKLFLLISGIILLAGCGQFAPADRAEKPAPQPAMEQTAGAPPGSGQSAPDVVHAANLDSAAITQKIIRNASLRLQVENYDASHAKIVDLVARRGGYIAAENENRRQHVIENQMTLRVPAESLDPLIEELQHLALYVHSKNITATDVTEEFVDLEARLRTKREVAARYEDILRQARTVPDILKVEAELRQVREEIESAEGRLRYLNHRVSFSTVNLSVYEQLSADSPPGRDFFSLLKDALAGGWEGLQWIIIGLLYLWPLWLFILVICWLIIRLIRRRRQHRQAPKNP